jgi:hypothetical protein
VFVTSQALAAILCEASTAKFMQHPAATNLNHDGKKAES